MVDINTGDQARPRYLVNPANPSVPPPTGGPSDPYSVKGAGFMGSASFTPTATAYGAGDIMDVAQLCAFTLSDGTAVPTGSVIRITTVVLKIDQTALQSGEGAYTLQCFSATPPSALADNAAWTLASVDLPHYRDALGLGTPVDLGAACFVKTLLTNPSDIKLLTTGLYCQLQTVAAFTPTAVARQVIVYGIVL